MFKSGKTKKDREKRELTPFFKYFLWGLFVLAFLLRAAYVLQKDDIAGTNVDGYPNIARNMVEGYGFSSKPGQLTSYRPPLYPLFLSLIYPLWGDDYSGVGLIQAGLSALTSILIYLIGKRIFGERVGRLAAAISVVYPFFIYYTGSLMTETLGTFLLALFLLSLIRAAETFSWKDSLAAGFTIGLSALCRPTVLAFIPFLLAGMLLAPTGGRKNKIVSLGIIATVFLATMSPWVIRNWQVQDKFIFTTTNGGYTLLMGNNSSFYRDVFMREPSGGLWPEKEFANWKARIFKETENLSEIERDRYFYSKAISFIKADSGRFLRLALFKLSRFWRLFPHVGPPAYKIVSLFSYGPLLVFAFAGIVGSLGLWRRTFFLYSIIAAFSITHALFWSQLRYRLSIMPFVIIFASRGIIFLYNGIGKRRRCLERG